MRRRPSGGRSPPPSSSSWPRPASTVAAAPPRPSTRRSPTRRGRPARVRRPATRIFAASDLGTRTAGAAGRPAADLRAAHGLPARRRGVARARRSSSTRSARRSPPPIGRRRARARRSWTRWSARCATPSARSRAAGSTRDDHGRQHRQHPVQRDALDDRHPRRRRQRRGHRDDAACLRGRRCGPQSRKVEPNSGVEGTCAGTPRRQPATTACAAAASTTSPTPATARTGQGYSPRRSRRGEAASKQVRDFPGLFERMNEPFLRAGFNDVP